MQKYDIIFFDADRTLFDYDKAEYNSLKNTFESYNISFNEQILNQYKIINNKLWIDFEKGLVTRPFVQTHRFAKLFEQLNLNEDIESFNRMFMSQLGKSNYLLDGAEQICKQLYNSCKLYIVTNGDYKAQMSRIETSAISRYISAIFVSDGSGSQKPHIEYFNFVFNKISGFDKKRSIIVGDSLTADIKGGNNAGIDTCWFNPKGEVNNTDAVCNYEITRLDELINIINMPL